MKHTNPPNNTQPNYSHEPLHSLRTTYPKQKPTLPELQTHLNSPPIQTPCLTEPSYTKNPPQYIYHKPPSPIPQPDSFRIFKPSSDIIPSPRQPPLFTNNWNSLISRTSKESSICGTNQRISKSKNFQSNLFSTVTTPYNERRLLKNTANTKHSTTTQIVALPGCVKRSKYDIKDDKKFYNKQNVGYLIKMQKEFNDVVNDKRFKEEEVNKFPTEERYGNSFGNKNSSQILGNEKKGNSKDVEIRKGKKRPAGGCNYRISQVELI